MNSYVKFCPNVFVVKCTEEHKSGETIVITTRRGKENEHIIHNFLGKTNDGFFLYSITRADGFNVQERAKRKADKLKSYAQNAEKRSSEYYVKSKKDSDFLSLGEPIKVGHHSEKRHRKIIDQAWNNWGKSVEESDKAQNYEQRAKYWEAQADKINLSMPESLEMYEYQLHKAKEIHAFYKTNPDKREHSFSLTYANKAVKQAQKNLELAVKLWGSEEEREQIDKEKQEQMKKVQPKKKTDLVEKFGGVLCLQ